MNVNLENKVAVVTGGTRGIGLACAEQLAASGATVAVVGRQPETVEKGTEIVGKKGKAHGYQLDVTDIPAIAPAIEKIRKDLGEIDILVCSAGIDIGKPTLAVDVTEKQWDELHSVNGKGLFFTNQAVAVQSMIPRRNGSIINIGSAVGLVGAPNCMPYNTSKAVVSQITRSEAIEWGPHNVRVNCVAPTWVETDLSKPLLSLPGFMEHELGKIPINRIARLDEIGAAVCFLASDMATMITGVQFPVDGGWTCQ
ncbi:MAG: SDR family oxidoreductase [Deltaproteobacteria bacterium]|nr:SDR family oxidoreductase [Deltaproteobacteria bacterium]